MNPHEWTRTIQHPYQEIRKAQDTHGHLLPTPVKVPPYSTFCIPFAWMTIRSQDEIAEHCQSNFPRIMRRLSTRTGSSAGGGRRHCWKRSSTA